jgi:hypothetical protein
VEGLTACSQAGGWLSRPRACLVPSKPVSLALSKLESHYGFSLRLRRSLWPASPRASSATLGCPHTEQAAPLSILRPRFFSWRRSLGRALARCTKSPASLAKLAMGLVRECLLPSACRGLIKIPSRRGVPQVLPQHPPIRPQTFRSMCLSHRLLLARK